MSEKEEWRPIDDWPYEVSNLGRVRHSVRRRIRRLSPSGPKGYLLFSVYAPQNTHRTQRLHSLYVHVLVCTAFHGPRPSQEHEVAHWDRDRSNNRASNLRWATKAENEADKVRFGLSNQGARHWNARLSAEDAQEIRALFAGGLGRGAIAARFNITSSFVTDIVNRRRWAWVP